MFGEFPGQAGDVPEEVNWEGWTPPWLRREGPGPRGPFGPGRGFRGFGGPRHGWGHHGHGHHGHHGPFGRGFGPWAQWGVPDELLALRAEAVEVARLFAIASRGAFENKERLSQLRAFLDRSRKELSDMIYGSTQGQTSGQSAQGSGPTDVGQA